MRKHCSLLGQDPEFHLPRKLLPGDAKTDALENQLHPTLKHTPSGDSAVFLKSALVCVWWQSLCSERWHSDSVSKKSHGSHADAPTECIPICLSEVKWSMQQGITYKQLAFTEYHAVLLLWKHTQGKNSPGPICRALIWGVPTTTWSIALRLELKTPFLPKAWAQIWRQLIGLLIAISFIKKTFNQPPLCRQWDFLTAHITICLLPPTSCGAPTSLTLADSLMINRTSSHLSFYRHFNHRRLPLYNRTINPERTNSPFTAAAVPHILQSRCVH